MVGQRDRPFDHRLGSELVVTRQVRAVQLQHGPDRNVESPIAQTRDPVCQAQDLGQCRGGVVQPARRVESRNLTVRAVPAQQRFELGHPLQRCIRRGLRRLEIVAEHRDVDAGAHQHAASRRHARSEPVQQAEFPGDPGSAPDGQDAQHVAP